MREGKTLIILIPHACALLSTMKNELLDLDS